MRRPSIAITCLLTVGVVSHAFGQSMLPLQSWLALPQDQKEPSYAFVRCAAYYKGMMQYIGTATLPKQAVDASVGASTKLAMAAVRIRAARQASPATQFVDPVMADIDRIANAYVARMKQNYAVSGQAFASDTLIRGDGEICKQVAEGL